MRQRYVQGLALSSSHDDYSLDLVDHGNYCVLWYLYYDRLNVGNEFFEESFLIDRYWSFGPDIDL